MLRGLFLRIVGLLGTNLLYRNKKIDPAKIRRVLVNRSDRLGDAIISLPFLLELQKYFEVTVLTSAYNDALLKPFLTTHIVIKKPPTLKEFSAAIFKNLFSLNFPRGQRKHKPPFDLYLDLIGIRGLSVFLKIKKEGLSKYYVGYNIFLWSWLLDFAYQGSLELSGKNIVEGSRELLKESLGIQLDIPDYVDLSPLVTIPSDLTLPPSFILCNIAGFDRFRGPSLEMYAQLLESLPSDIPIVVMDEPAQPHLKEFKRLSKRAGLIYLQRDYSINELLFIAKHSLLYLGSDSGISHILENPTHCIIFFGTEKPSAWKPFSKNPYTRKKIKKMMIEETITSVGLVKKIIYSPVWCRPCYDIGCRELRCIKNIAVTEIRDEVTSLLSVQKPFLLNKE